MKTLIHGDKCLSILLSLKTLFVRYILCTEVRSPIKSAEYMLFHFCKLSHSNFYIIRRKDSFFVFIKLGAGSLGGALSKKGGAPLFALSLTRSSPSHKCLQRVRKTRFLNRPLKTTILQCLLSLPPSVYLYYCDTILLTPSQKKGFVLQHCHM